MRLAYWMYQGTAHHGVGRIANSMRGVHAVFHAPQGDDYVTPIFSMLERAPALPQMTTSVVSGKDLARGTLQLPETLRQVAARVQPELIVITASCSTVLLQENLEQVAASAEIDSEVIVYDANPYRMQEIAAAEGLFTLLVERYARPQPRTPQPSVNLLGPASLGFHARADLICLRRMLAALGVQVNVVAPWGADLADLARLPAAWVTVAPYRELGQGAGAFLGRQFDIPLLDDAPMGVQPTLAWLNKLLGLLNEVGAQQGAAPLALPPLTAFSLDGLSAPSGVPWFARTADMESFSRKQAFVFGDATHTVGMTRFLHDELGMQIAGAGTYLPQQADWMRAQLADYLPDELLVTDEFQQVAREIEQRMPDLVCGTQMERHSCRKLDMPAMVIAPPTHIENHLLGYYPVLGFAGADVLADEVYTTTKLGLEKHLIDMFGDAGLDYEPASESSAATTDSAPASNGSSAAGTDTDAHGAQPPSWTPEAEAMLKKIPFFVRGRVRRNTEKFAAEQGHSLITEQVLRAAKEALGG
jgi:light-independent protochlorophyllide reductase subunit B